MLVDPRVPNRLEKREVPTFILKGWHFYTVILQVATYINEWGLSACVAKTRVHLFTGCFDGSLVRNRKDLQTNIAGNYFHKCALKI